MVFCKNRMQIIWHSTCLVQLVKRSSTVSVMLSHSRTYAPHSFRRTISIMSEISTLNSTVLAILFALILFILTWNFENSLSFLNWLPQILQCVKSTCVTEHLHVSFCLNKWIYIHLRMVLIGWPWNFCNSLVFWIFFQQNIYLLNIKVYG